MPHRSSNCSELFISPLFGDPISNQCLCGFCLTGGASALRYILPPVLWFPLGFILDPCQSPQAPRSPSVPDTSIGPTVGAFCRTSISIAGRGSTPAAGRTSALCFSFPAPKPIRRAPSHKHPLSISISIPQDAQTVGRGPFFAGAATPGRP